MPVISIACSKGGVGKSTIASSLAVAIQQAGYTVALADCDEQFSATRWIDIRDENEKLPKIKHIQKVGRIRTAINDLTKEYEFVVIDTGGHDNPEMRQSLIIADLVLIPLKQSQYDLDVVAEMSQFIEEAREIDNESLKDLYVLNMVNPLAQSKKALEAMNALKSLDHINVFKDFLYNRDVYVQTSSEGMGVTELKDVKARTEFKKLTKYIINQLKGKKHARIIAKPKKTAAKTRKKAG